MASSQGFAPHQRRDVHNADIRRQPDVLPASSSNNVCYWGHRVRVSVQRAVHVFSGTCGLVLDHLPSPCPLRAQKSGGR